MGRLNKKEFIKKYGEEAWKEKMDRARQYRAEHKERYREIYNKYYDKHKEEVLARDRAYYHKTKDEKKESKKNYFLTYHKTQNGRAGNLLSGYKRDDLKSNYGECTLTKDWIIDNIFTSSCIYCGETDWKKLGCDRIDNEKAHTPENCVCSCGTCNVERGDRWTVEEFIEYKRQKG